MLFQGSSSASFSSHNGSDDCYDQHHQQQSCNNSNSMMSRIRRMSGRNHRPKSVADMDDLTRNIQNIRLTNSQAQEYDSIEHLEAAQPYNKQYYNTYAQVRNSKSLYFNSLGADNKSRTWNQDDTRQYRNSRYLQTNEYCPSAFHQKRLSVSSFRYDDSSFAGAQSQHHSLGRGFKEKVQRSLSCERSRQARQMVKTFKISSDKFHENFSKLSSNINNKLGDTKLSQLNCVASSENLDETRVNDCYKPSKDDEDDDDAGFNSMNNGCFAPGLVSTPVTLTTPTTSLGSHHQANAQNFQDIKSPSLSVFSCTEPQVRDF